MISIRESHSGVMIVPIGISAAGTKTCLRLRSRSLRHLWGGRTEPLQDVKSRAARHDQRRKDDEEDTHAATRLRF